MPWWLLYLIALVALLVLWLVFRAWVRRRPNRQVDDKKLANLRESAEARDRRFTNKWQDTPDKF